LIGRRDGSKDERYFCIDRLDCILSIRICAHSGNVPSPRVVGKWVT
jgi:hypothetical protein